jgi:hypothetical protein
MGGGCNFRTVIHYDYLPSGRFSTRLLMLTNIGGDFKYAGKSGSLGAVSIIRNPKHRWSLRCYSVRARWDDDNERYEPEGWRAEGTIEVRFKESFQALSKGEDFYFVTRSGKLFRAPKPKEGKDRKMETVWNKPDQRINTFITDVDTNRTFLFCAPAQAGARPTYFELGPKPKPVSYDPTSVKQPKTKGPLGTVLLCSRVLLKDKMIKIAPDKKHDKPRAKP